MTEKFDARGLIGLAVLLMLASGAEAQTIGTFKWQTEPFCNVLTLTVIQQGAGFQLVGSDDLCGSGPVPVTGAAVLSGGGVQFGLVVALPSGRAAHLSATVGLEALSGSWTDDDANGGGFQFTTAGTGGSPRPLPALPPLRLDATVTLGSQGLAPPTGVSAMTGAVMQRGVAWRAPRNCTMTGTATVSGGATAGQFILTFFLLDAEGNQINGTRSDLTYTSAIPSNTVRTFQSRAVLAGQLVVLGELNFAGLVMSPATVAYVSLACR